MAMKYEPLPMNQRRQAQRSQLVEAELGEMAFLVASEDQTEDFFGKPAMEQPELLEVGDVLQEIIDDGDVAHSLLDDL